MATLDGIKVSLGGRDFIVPPLTLGALRKHGSTLRTLQDLGDIPTSEQLDGIVAIIHAAMARNYPDLTREDLEELVDLKALPVLFRAVAGQSGLTQGAGDGSGEAVP